jgi:hypothetical protein
MAVASWFPLDLANVEARPDLGVTPEILNYLFRLKRADDLIAGVDALVERGVGAQTANTALYALLLRRLPAPSELAMIVSRHPHHAMIAILSGDEYRKQGRRASWPPNPRPGCSPSMSATR